ncbi:MAG: L-2-amino-thiazoline-4-carboxylic acid hydrolase [Aeriscardovia sp.]|nr:L-2-amino-thiazoline-4-carboxylic acid hydrolase [Aeriscardovia sp.]
MKGPLKSPPRPLFAAPLLRLAFGALFLNRLKALFGSVEVLAYPGYLLFCRLVSYDDIAFSGLMPEIRFERTGTLGKNADRCDFHFVKNK